MKREYKSIVYGIAAVFAFWLVDTFVDYLTHAGESFSEALLFNRTQVSPRAIFSLCFLVFILYTAKVLAKQRRTEDVLVKEVLNRRHAQERLKLFSQAVEMAMDGIQITDLDGYIVYSNKTVEAIYGFPLEELIGKHVNELNADPRFAHDVIIPAIKAAGRWNGELMVIHKEGRELPIWLSASMVMGEMTGLLLW